MYVFWFNKCLVFIISFILDSWVFGICKPGFLWIFSQNFHNYKIGWLFGKKSAVYYKHVQYAIIKFFSRKCYYFNCKFYNVVRDSPSQVSNSKKFVRILSELNYEIYLFKLSFRNVLFEVYASIRGEEIGDEFGAWAQLRVVFF